MGVYCSSLIPRHMAERYILARPGSLPLEELARRVSIARTDDENVSVHEPDGNGGQTWSGVYTLGEPQPLPPAWAFDPRRPVAATKKAKRNRFRKAPKTADEYLP